MNDRERGFEAKYSFDLEQDFRIEAHLYKMLAMWAGEQMGLSPAACQDYAKKVIGEVITNPKENSIINFLMIDLERENTGVTLSTVQAKLEELRPVARAELLGG